MDYDWTSVKSRCMRERAPYVWVQEMKPTASALRQFAKGYMSLGNSKASAAEFYENLYQAKFVDEHRLPFFSDAVRSFQNDYADTFSNISQRGAQFVGAGLASTAAGALEEAVVGSAALAAETQTQAGSQLFENIAKTVEGVGDAAAKMFGANSMGFKIPRPTNPGENPGSYIETPKFYQYANTDVALEVNFVLSNTINDGGHAKNYEFIQEFTRGARPTRGGAVSLTFPNIYKVRVPGWRWIEWAALANFAVAFLGTRRMMGKNIVPEAYGISMTFQSLTLEVANFLDKVH